LPRVRNHPHYSAPPDPLAVFKGPTSKGRERKRERGREGERKGEGRVGEGREGKGWKGKGGEGREERGMGACTHWDFRKSAPMYGGHGVSGFTFGDVCLTYR